MEEQQENQNAQHEQDSFMENKLDVSLVQNTTYAIKQEIGKVVVGQNKMLDLLIIALLTNGHVLIEGVPGIAKTLTAKLLAKVIDLDFSRIQFTPDLMPTDVLGTSVFNLKNSDFTFNKGPIFSNLILIDEINRAPAKTQAALFEVMEEKQATIDGTTYPMALPFFVMATQNPIEQEGTYKLPEAQLDRFLFRIKIDYPSVEEEVQILNRFKSSFDHTKTINVDKKVSAKDIQNCLETIEQVHIKDELIKYIAEIIDNTRNNGDLTLGASPRASLAILKCAKAQAAINGRDFVTPDDIQAVAFPVLNHRIILNPDKEIEGTKEEEIIQEIIEKIEVPR
ncbi:MAG: MoxR family ATPase [Bacteroidetes bacterium]|nr:MoxR family ATPase [Bacteroidota bacterium]MCB9226642.1 MoxR family ATPase [Chitinophagales bacterium]